VHCRRAVDHHKETGSSMITDRGVGGAVPSAQELGMGWVLPLAEGFTPRHDTMPELEAALALGSAVALVPAGETGPENSGWGAACGKTQLAVCAARSLQRCGAVEVVVWVAAHSRIAVLDGFARAAADLGLEKPDGAAAMTDRFAAWMRETRRRWLLVLDDLRDAADLEDLWPAGPAGTVLITADNPAAVSGQPVRVLPVPLFSVRESVEYLSGRFSADPGHRAGQLELAAALDGEPTALAHASAVIATADLTCRDYLVIFTGLRARLEAVAGAAVPAAEVTWRLSAQHAEILAPSAGTWPLLVLAALLDGHGIPVPVLTGPAACRYLADGDDGRPADPGQAQTALQALQHAGLLAVDASGGLPAARISAALQQAARAAASPQLLGKAAQAAGDALIQTWPKDQLHSVMGALLRSCAASLQAVAAEALWAGGSCHRVLLTAGRSLDAAGMPGSAAAWWQQLAADSDRILGEEHPDTIAAAGLLAEALLAAGQAVEAVTWANWVQASRARTLGPDHRGTIAAMVCLGRALTAGGRPEDAIFVLENAARRSERVCGADDDATISARAEHAAACLAAGDPAGAVRLLQQSLAGQHNARGPAHPATLATAARLAGAYLAAGQARHAIAQWQQILTRHEHAAGPEHPDTLSARTSLAGACSAAGQMDAALHHYQQAHAGYEHVLGTAHPDTLACAADLARAYCDAGQLGDAVRLLRAAITAAEETLPPGDPAARGLRELLAGISEETAAR
jgi:tetratricopeptide (TPR) repeat protein